MEAALVALRTGAEPSVVLAFLEAAAEALAGE